MKLLTYQRRANSDRAGILLDGNRILDVGMGYSRKIGPNPTAEDTAGIIDSLRGLSSSWLEVLRASEDAVRDIFELEKSGSAGELEDCIYSFGDVQLRPPLLDPPALLQFNPHEGHAHAELIRLTGNPEARLPEAWSQCPVYTFANPGALLATGHEVEFPEGEAELDFEAQVAAVLGETVYQSSPEEAADALFGFTLAVTWVARGQQRTLFPLGPGPSKAFAITLGPWVATVGDVDPAAIQFSVSVDGEEWTVGHVADARFGFAEMASFASQSAPLAPGTLLLGGAAAGASCLERGQFLKLGSRVELTADALGTLSATISQRRRPNCFAPTS